MADVKDGIDQAEQVLAVGTDETSAARAHPIRAKLEIFATFSAADPTAPLLLRGPLSSYCPIEERLRISKSEKVEAFSEPVVYRGE